MIAEISQKRLDGRIALVTGASRGIGRAVAINLAAEGAHVVLVARTQGGLEEVDDEIRALGGSATLTPMDLTEFDAIDKLGAALYERYQKLDIVVGNAGMLGGMSPIHQIDPQVWDQVLAINLTANWRLIRSFDPLMRASDAGRMVFLSSGAAQGHRAFWGIYAVSKAALEMTVGTYSQEILKTNIKVNAFDPGRTRTNMRAEAYPGEDPQTLKTPEFLAPQIVEMVLPSCMLNGEVVTAKEPEDAGR